MIISPKVVSVSSVPVDVVVFVGMGVGAGGGSVLPWPGISPARTGIDTARAKRALMVNRFIV